MTATGAPVVRPDDRPASAVATMVGAARDLVATGVPLQQAAAELAAAAPGRAALQGAHIEIARRMHGGPSDDFAATTALRVVHAALGLLARQDGERSAGAATARRRGSPWKR